MVGVAFVKLGSRELIMFIEKSCARMLNASNVGWTVESWNITALSVTADVTKDGSNISDR